jgi:hypothetical protein
MTQEKTDPGAEIDFIKPDYRQNVILIEGDPLNPKVNNILFSIFKIGFEKMFSRKGKSCYHIE